MSTTTMSEALSLSSASFFLSNAFYRDMFDVTVPETICLTIVVFGASGDLAKKKTYPALFQLYSKGFFPSNVHILGYARTDMTDNELRSQVRPHLKGPEDSVKEFLKVLTYQSGQYNTAEGFIQLQETMYSREQENPRCPCGRLYYLALPPSVYPEVCTQLKINCDSMNERTNPKSFLRVVVEKPFGRDFDSAESLSHKLGRLYHEDQLYRIDHYLGKELTQNLMAMRFENGFFESWWNRQYVANVQVTFKEDFGVEGRAGYFDEYGIIRDVIQNHLLQLMTLVAMEKPVSKHPDDIRDEKLKVLRCVKPLSVEDCVIGQYAGRGEKMGYLQDTNIPAESNTPTFAVCVLNVHNSRWEGVPFILKAGKALDERKSEIRIQLKTPPAPLYLKDDNNRNEFVMRLQPDEAIYMKMLVKKPGLESDVAMSELDLSYIDRYKDVVIPDAYERLILDVINGDQQHFVRRDELMEAWKIFTPLLGQIDQGIVRTESYIYGTRGPRSADELLKKVGYVRSEQYTWKK